MHQSARVQVLDGALGSEIEARGVTMDPISWCARATLTHPDVVRQVHVDYLRAGADVIMTNTHSSLLAPLEHDGFGDLFEPINRRAVALCQEAIEEAATGPITIAGAIGAAPSFVRPDLPSDPVAQHSARVEDYERQAFLLAEAGVDVLVLELVVRREHAAAAVEAALATGLPVWASVSADVADEHGVIPSFVRLAGVESVPVADVVDEIKGSDVAACMVMHSPLEAVSPTLDLIAERWDIPLGTYPHHGHWARPSWVMEGLEPADFLRYAQEWIDRGVGWIGACCGIGPAYIAELARMVKQPGA